MISKYIYIGIAIVTFITGIYYKIHTLNNTIEEQSTTITELNKDIVINKMLINNRENTIDELSANLITVKSTIDRINADVLAKEKELAKYKQKYNDWMSKPPKEKYIYITKEVLVKDVNYSNTTCEEGIKLNKKISEINYNDL